MATTSDDYQNGRQGPGRGVLGPFGTIIMIVYMVLFTIFVVYSLVAFWPPVRSDEAKARISPSPTPTPTVTPTPTPTATPILAIGAAAPRTGSPTRSQAPARTTATPAATPTPSPTPTPTPTPTPGNTSAATIKEGFCLDENNKIREDVGAYSYFGRWQGCMYDEDRLLIIVLLSGALGALVHGLRSLSWYIGNRKAVLSWTAMYTMLPFLGAGLAAIAYFVIRGGFFSTQATVSDTSPFAFAALSALAGMFTEPTVNKLRKVAISVLEPPDQGKDHVGPAPKITNISPPRGSTAGGDTVTLTGTDFSAAPKITFGGVEATVESSTETSVTLTTPAHAAGKVDVVVVNEDQQQHVIKEGFEYVEPSAGGDAG